MKVYGVTGGAGSGKSEVLKLLENEFNFCVILSDDVTRALQKKGNISYDLIVEHFGPEVLQEDGELDRKALAVKVFGDPAELEALNSFTHPQTMDAIRDIIRREKWIGEHSGIALETALMFESGANEMCDEVWYVYTEPGIRRERMKTTRGYSDEKVDAVMASQKDDEFFFRNCDFIIENNGTLDEVREQLCRKLEGACGETPDPEGREP
ncbi:MAG: dephospho-CoA kinase [Lachnospiraceae bacterium]|nr:dephospho-CoA kinase [Lachnospiraceae bacterium]